MDILASAAAEMMVTPSPITTITNLLNADGIAELHKKRKNKSLDDTANKFSRVLAPNLQRWRYHETFYPSIDRAYFANSDFKLCLNVLGLDSVTIGNRAQWAEIRSLISHKIGRPRRFSSVFLHSEREKLHENRRELRASKPMISCHSPVTVFDSTTKIFHTGTVIAAELISKDQMKYLIKFDQVDLGTELVDDIYVATHDSGDFNASSPKSDDSTSDGFSRRRLSQRSFMSSQTSLLSDEESEDGSRQHEVMDGREDHGSIALRKSQALVDGVWPQLFKEGEVMYQKCREAGFLGISDENVRDEPPDETRGLIIRCISTLLLLQNVKDFGLEGQDKSDVFIALSLKICSDMGMGRGWEFQQPLELVLSCLLDLSRRLDEKDSDDDRYDENDNDDSFDVEDRVIEDRGDV